MRTIVMLLVAVLVMTPALAHAEVPSGAGALFVLAVPVVAVALLIYGIIWIAKQAGAETETPTPETLSAPPLAPEVGSNR